VKIRGAGRDRAGLSCSLRPAGGASAGHGRGGRSGTDDRAGRSGPL